MAVIAASFAAGDRGGDGGGEAGDGGNGTPLTASTPTTERVGFPPAGDQSVCSLISDAEAETMVGRRLDHEVIEPEQAQCAWPVEEGTPLDAALFFIIKERPDGALRDALLEVYTADQYSLERVGDLADDAFFVLKDASGGEPPFVEGLEATTGQLHVVLGNGGNADAWEGTPEEIRQRLRGLMEIVLGRIGERVGERVGDR